MSEKENHDEPGPEDRNLGAADPFIISNTNFVESGMVVIRPTELESMFGIESYQDGSDEDLELKRHLETVALNGQCQALVIGMGALVLSEDTVCKSAGNFMYKLLRWESEDGKTAVTCKPRFGSVQEKSEYGNYINGFPEWLTEIKGKGFNGNGADIEITTTYPLDDESGSKNQPATFNQTTTLRYLVPDINDPDARIEILTPDSSATTSDGQYFPNAFTTYMNMAGVVETSSSEMQLVSINASHIQMALEQLRSAIDVEDLVAQRRYDQLSAEMDASLGGEALDLTQILGSLKRLDEMAENDPWIKEESVPDGEPARLRVGSEAAQDARNLLVKAISMSQPFSEIAGVIAKLARMETLKGNQDAVTEYCAIMDSITNSKPEDLARVHYLGSRFIPDTADELAFVGETGSYSRVETLLDKGSQTVAAKVAEDKNYLYNPYGKEDDFKVLNAIILECAETGLPPPIDLIYRSTEYDVPTLWGKTGSTLDSPKRVDEASRWLLQVRYYEYLKASGEADASALTELDGLLMQLCSPKAPYSDRQSEVIIPEVIGLTESPAIRDRLAEYYVAITGIRHPDAAMIDGLLKVGNYMLSVSSQNSDEHSVLPSIISQKLTDTFDLVPSEVHFNDHSKLKSQCVELQAAVMAYDGLPSNTVIDFIDSERDKQIEEIKLNAPERARDTSIFILAQSAWAEANRVRILATVARQYAAIGLAGNSRSIIEMNPKDKMKNYAESWTLVRNQGQLMSMQPLELKMSDEDWADITDIDIVNKKAADKERKQLSELFDSARVIVDGDITELSDRASYIVENILFRIPDGGMPIALIEGDYTNLSKEQLKVIMARIAANDKAAAQIIASRLVPIQASSPYTGFKDISKEYPELVSGDNLESLELARSLIARYPGNTSRAMMLTEFALKLLR